MHKSLVSLLTLGLVGCLAAIALSQTHTAFGYGYGTCTAERPNELAAEYVSDNERIELSWAEVVFSDCADTAPASYKLQVRKTDATLVSEYSDITKLYKRISADNLKTNKPYKFRVRAVATDDSQTDWSLYKSFRTLPKKPSDVTITQTGEGTITVDWDNVPRSKKLRYYQVQVKRGDHVVYSKRLSLGLRKNRTGTDIEGLKSDTQYRLKVRAVARSSSKGEYAKQYFTLQ